MPRGKAELRDYLKRCLERVERVPEDEPWSQIRFPRQEAKKRVSNEKKSKRIVIVTDEQNFREFHAIFEAYKLECGDDPTMAVYGLIEAAKCFDLRSWREEKADQAHVMGTDEHVGE